MVSLDPEEKNVLDSYERGEWQSVGQGKGDFTRYREYARATFKKDRRVNIRISSTDLEGLQKRALEEGIPYQTLISSILHKYLGGRLVDAGFRVQTGTGLSRETLRPSSTEESSLLDPSYLTEMQRTEMQRLSLPKEDQ